MIKKYFWEILLVMLLFVSDLIAKSEIIESKVLSSDKFNISDIASADLFVDGNDNVFVEVAGREDFLWLNNKWVSTEKYGGYLKGFVKDGCVYLAFRKNRQNIDIYSVGKDIIIENHITIDDSDFLVNSTINRVVFVPGDNNASYLLGSKAQLPFGTIISSGHGPSYEKPVLAEIQGQKVLEHEKLPYGGKTDESYHVKKVLTGKDAIYFFGFKVTSVPAPEILHYAEYNVKKRKLIRAQDIYEKLPDFNKSDKPRNLYIDLSSYWHVSADNFNDDLYVAFSWHGFRFFRNENSAPKINMENINSPIYYSQSSGKEFSNIEVIGRGILPLVRTDSLGNVHVIWSNSNGDLVHKLKKGDKWSEEQIILNNVIDTGEVWEDMRQVELCLQNVSAEFDKNNNLNVVFLSNENLVLAKIKFD